jgi:PEP-CTERM motif
MKRAIFNHSSSALVTLAIFAAATDAYAAELIQNGGFESPYLGPSNWTAPGVPYNQGYYGYLVYPYPTLDGWTYHGTALINAQGWNPAIGGATPPGFGGDQFAGLQGYGSLSQYFVSPGGDLTLSWLNGGRPMGCCYGGDETYAVKVDGTTVGTFSTVSGQAFTPETLALTDVSAGLHQLIFQGTDTIGADESVFFDNVSILTGGNSAIPEPATWVLVIAGFGALGAATWLRRKQLVRVA